ncbi:MAG: cation:proton antiporter [Clostridiales bacterium]|nr:cation:proton antiporter [Clostridiales bacterium]
MNTILSIAIAMLVGLLLTRVVKLVNLPNVTAYLIAGLIVRFLGGFAGIKLENLGEISEVALGFIAFSIGGEFKLSNIKKLGGKIIIITLVQALGACLFVMAGLFVAQIIVGKDQISTPLVLLLSVIATATAPAATLMVVRQFKAKGPVTDTLLPVVALDDAVGLIMFSINFAIAKVLVSGEAITVYAVAIEPLIEIGLSLAVGLVLGGLLALACKFFLSRANRLCLIVVVVFIGVGLAKIWPLSSLLTGMMTGAAFANFRKDSVKILEGPERWTPPLFMIFFILSGAELDVSVLASIGVAGIVYLVCRSLGKYFGAYVGASMVKSEKSVRKYLGITLLPQAGVAIGMAQLVFNTPEFSGTLGTTIMTIVLAATLVYELVGPVLTKISLERAGEIVKEKKEKTNGQTA